jgi:hypothetical protein
MRSNTSMQQTRGRACTQSKMAAAAAAADREMEMAFHCSDKS